MTSRVSYPEGNVLKMASISTYKPFQSREHVVHYDIFRNIWAIYSCILRLWSGYFMWVVHWRLCFLNTTHRRKSQTVRSGDLAGQGISSLLETPHTQTHTHTHTHTTFMDVHAAWKVGWNRVPWIVSRRAAKYGMKNSLWCERSAPLLQSQYYTAFETWWHARRNQISSFGETDESI